jgi:hypothetical protein
MDSGRSAFDSDEYSRTGDVLGKVLALTSDQQSHNFASFSESLADPEVFRGISQKLEEYLSSI